MHAVGPRAYPGDLMSSLFDDLSLPDAFRRLEGVSVTPQPPRTGPGASTAEETPYEEGHPDEDAPPEEDEPPYDELPPQPVDLPPAPPRRPAPVTGGPALEELVDGLNPAQREAVEHRGSPLLIVAGAGSGKTRVLTRRIAHLLRTGEALPGEILAITFTNKAAAEMRERVEELIGPAARSMWVSTFHSACVRILRRDAAAAGLK